MATLANLAHTIQRNVAEAHFKFNLIDHGAAKIPLDTLLPDVQKLTITSPTGYFPFTLRAGNRLTHFTSDSAFTNVADVGAFLQSCTKLHSFAAPIEWRHNYMHRLAKLPQLSTLDVELMGELPDQPSITGAQFYGVRTLALKVSVRGETAVAAAYSVLSFIRFDGLESFKMVGPGAGTATWVDLIVRNKDLRFVEVEQIELTAANVEALIGSLEKLSRITFVRPAVDEANRIVAYLAAAEPTVEQVCAVTDAAGSELFRSLRSAADKKLLYRLEPKQTGNDGYVKVKLKRVQRAPTP